MSEHKDQLLKHEHSLCPHPHHRRQCEVVDQNRHEHTASIDTCSVNTTDKDNQHAEQSNAELDMKLGGISVTQLPVCIIEIFWLVRPTVLDDSALRLT